MGRKGRTGGRTVAVGGMWAKGNPQGRRTNEAGICCTLKRGAGFQPAILRRIAIRSLSLTCLSRLIANRFNHAPLSARMRLRMRRSSSRNGMSRHHCSVSSMAQCPRTQAVNCVMCIRSERMENRTSFVVVSPQALVRMATPIALGEEVVRAKEIQWAEPTGKRASSVFAHPLFGCGDNTTPRFSRAILSVVPCTVWPHVRSLLSDPRWCVQRHRASFSAG